MDKIGVSKSFSLDVRSDMAVNFDTVETMSPPIEAGKALYISGADINVDPRPTLGHPAWLEVDLVWRKISNGKREDHLFARCYSPTHRQFLELTAHSADGICICEDGTEMDGDGQSQFVIVRKLFSTLPKFSTLDTPVVVKRDTQVRVYGYTETKGGR